MLKFLNCQRCGKEYETENRFSMYCSEHCRNYETRICLVCGKEFEGKIISNKKTCSKECSKILRERTTLNKYGFKNIAQNETVKQIIQDKRKEQMPEIINKMKQTLELKKNSRDKVTN